LFGELTNEEGEGEVAIVGPVIAALFSALPPFLAQHPGIKLDVEAEGGCDNPGNGPFLIALGALVSQPAVSHALVRLAANFYETEDETAAAFLSSLSAATRLTRLELDTLHLPNWPSYFKNCGELKEMHLAVVRVVHDEAHEFARLTALTRLCIAEYWFDYGAISGLTGLRELVFYDISTYVGADEPPEDLDEFNLSPLTRLTSLEASGLETTSLSHLGPLPPSLVHLKLGYRVRCEGRVARRVWDAGWGPLPALETLSLSYRGRDVGEDPRSDLYFRIEPDFKLVGCTSLKTLSLTFDSSADVYRG
jgi:hypothetical protein